METTIKQALTYDLRANPAWTASLGILADDFVVEGIQLCAPLLRAYYAWNPEFARGPLNIESMLEGLTFGVMWNLYAQKQDQDLTDAVLEPEIFIAGIPAGRMLLIVNRFLETLSSAGEFGEEVRRIRRFANFFETLAEDDIRKYLFAMSRYAVWFRNSAREVLGNVTQSVDEFRMHAIENDGYRDDTALRSRHEVEYHLNLLSVIVLNYAWHDKYEITEKKLLVLPGCMRPSAGLNCPAKATRLGLFCTRCTEECAVNRVQQVAQQHGIETVVIQHQSTVFSQQHAESIREEGYAIIGVACALSLQAGGWKAQDAGIPAQCVPLLFPGCARHWAEENDLITEIDIGYLIDIINYSNPVLRW